MSYDVQLSPGTLLRQELKAAVVVASSRAVPGKVLRPSDPSHAGPVVVAIVPLGTPPATNA